MAEPPAVLAKLDAAVAVWTRADGATASGGGGSSSAKPQVTPLALFAKLDAAVAAWTRADLSAERHIALDQQGLEIADNQERSAEGREELKDVIRHFRAVPAEERPGQIGVVIRAFQAEVDALTRRQSSAETAFLSLYRSLDDAPDPVPVLREASIEVRRLTSEAAEVEGLRQQLADYDREFTSLKNQDATIRRLERQLREVDSKSENVTSEAIEAALATREAEWQERASAAEEQHREREEASAAKLSRAHEEAREATRAHQQAQETLFEMRSGFEQAQEAAAAEMEVMRAELERATAAHLATDKQRAALEEQLLATHASASGAAAAAAAEKAAAAQAAAQAAEARLEGQLSHKELQLAQTSAQLSAAERQLAALEERAQRERAALEAQVAEAGEALAAARAHAAALPSVEDHARLRAELAALQAQQLSMGPEAVVSTAGAAAEAAELLAAAGVTDRDEATAAAAAGATTGGRSMSALHAAHAQRLQAEVALHRSQLADVEAELQSARLSEAKQLEQLRQQAATIAELEDRWVQQQRASGMASGMAGSMASGSGAISGGGVAPFTPQDDSRVATPGGAGNATGGVGVGSVSGAAEALSAVLLQGGRSGGSEGLFGASSVAPATPATPGGGAGAGGGGGSSAVAGDTSADVAASGAGAGASGMGLEPLASSSADDAFKLVCGQRERARRQVEDLEAELARLKDVSHGHQAEARRLQADNLKLYEKVKFLQSTAAAGAHSSGSALAAPTPVGHNSIEEQATEGRYQKLYEEKVNPFAAFHRRERQQRYAELPAPEKLMLNFSQFFLANRHARLFLFGYMVCLHLLVSGAMYAATHHC